MVFRVSKASFSIFHRARPRRQLCDGLTIDREIGDKTVVVGHPGLVVAYRDRQPIDIDRAGLATQRHVAEPSISVCHPLLAAPELSGSVRGGRVFAFVMKARDTQG